MVQWLFHWHHIQYTLEVVLHIFSQFFHPMGTIHIPSYESSILSSFPPLLPLSLCSLHPLTCLLLCCSFLSLHPSYQRARPSHTAAWRQTAGSTTETQTPWHARDTDITWHHHCITWHSHVHVDGWDETVVVIHQCIPLTTEPALQTGILSITHLHTYIGIRSNTDFHFAGCHGYLGCLNNTYSTFIDRLN